MAPSQASRFYHATASTNKDWSSSQYLKFNEERTRPARDLLSQVHLEGPSRVVDLGCGPANSTEVLLACFPGANISGIDSSEDMIQKAKATLPHIEFSLSDLNTYHSKEPVDLYFCNAVLQWIPYSERIKLVTRLIQSQPSGGVFAFQVPNNLTEPSHQAMTKVAAEEGPWTKFYNGQLPQRTKIQTPQELYDQLGPHCASVDIWQTEYQHVLDSHQEIVEWVKGTGLRPFIDPLPAAEKEEYLVRYQEKLKKAYPVSYDGKVLFKFPRLFVVAVRK